MRLRIIVVGRPGRAVDEAFVAACLRRLRPVWPTEVVSVTEERLTSGRNEREVLLREAERIREKMPSGWPLVVLDRAGTAMDSPSFAARLRAWEESAVRGVAFVIGGPMGLDGVLVGEAALRLSFGPMTFPHDLAFVMLCEQLYRALAITRGWPYHR